MREQAGAGEGEIFVIPLPISFCCVQFLFFVPIWELGFISPNLGIRVHSFDLGIGFRIFALASILSGWMSTLRGLEVKEHPWS